MLLCVCTCVCVCVCVCMCQTSTFHGHSHLSQVAILQLSYQLCMAHNVYVKGIIYYQVITLVPSSQLHSIVCVPVRFHYSY